MSAAPALGLACATAPLNTSNTWGWSVPVGTPVSVSVGYGGTTATLRGSADKTNGNPTLSQPTLTISRRGHTAVTAVVTPPAHAQVVQPWDIGRELNQPGGWQPLCVATFAGQSAPTALLGLDLGGAHCCLTLRALFVGPDGTVSTLDRDLGNAGAVLAVVAGQPVIRTEDNAFAYEFTDYAGSAMPVRILTVSGYRFADVTAHHLDLVRADAARWWQAFRPGGPDSLGLLAAWVADECALGESGHAFSVVNQLNRQGKLIGPQGWPSGTAFVRNLRGFLIQHRYLSPSGTSA